MTLTYTFCSHSKCRISCPFLFLGAAPKDQSHPSPWSMFRSTVKFCGWKMVAPRSTPKLEDHFFSAICNSLFNIFAAAVHIWRPLLHPQPEDAPCRRDRTHLSRNFVLCQVKIKFYFLQYCLVPGRALLCLLSRE